MYRPPSRPPKRAWARHLHEVRKQRDLSQTQAFELVYEGLGISRKSRAVYVAIDMGDRQPTAREAEYLASVFGWPPEPEDLAYEEPSAPDVASVLLRQAEGIATQNAYLARITVALERLAGITPPDADPDEPPDRFHRIRERAEERAAADLARDQRTPTARRRQEATA